MNLGFYGHSSCRSKKENSHTSLLADRLSANLVNIGVSHGSEERILHELKKTKKIDFAVIFHSYPWYVYILDVDRDIDITKNIEEKAEYMFSKHYQDFENAEDLDRDKHPRFYKKYSSALEFQNIITSYKKNFYDFDLFKYRFEGAVISIDYYLKFKNLPCYHIVDPDKNFLPSWYKIQSGPVDYELMTYIKSKQSRGPNLISKEANQYVADYLYDKIAASGRVVHTPNVQFGDGGSNPPAAPANNV